VDKNSRMKSFAEEEEAVAVIDEFQYLKAEAVLNKKGMEQPQGRQKFQTPGAALRVSTVASTSYLHTTDSAQDASPTEAMNAAQLTYFGIGSLVGMALATVVAFYLGRRRNSWRYGRRQRGSLNHKPWDNEIKFHDECDSTDNDEFDDLEDGYGYYKNYLESHPRGPIDAFDGRSFDETSEDEDEHDWLGGVGFEEDGSHNSESVNEFPYVEDESERSEDDNDSIELLLNGDSPISNRSSSLLSYSTPLSPSENTFSPPTVSEVFQNTISSHWKQALPLTRPSNTSTFEELQKEQEELNKSLYLLNDHLLEQQRELEDAAQTLSNKTTRRKHRDSFQQHKKITDEIARLEAEKDDIDVDLKEVRSKIKAHRLERRRKLFLNSGRQ